MNYEQIKPANYTDDGDCLTCELESICQDRVNDYVISTLALLPHGTLSGMSGAQKFRHLRDWLLANNHIGTDKDEVHSRSAKAYLESL